MFARVTSKMLGILEIVETESVETDAIFDLAGRRLNAIAKPGIYIVNGKKVLIK